jgi:hypothetical protein
MLLLVFYRLVLEKEKIHQFNRFFLLGSIVFSFLAPLYIINIYIPVETIEYPFDLDESLLNGEIVQDKSMINYWMIAAIVSIIISFIFLIRFIINLSKIFLKIKQHTKVKIDNATLVLVDDLISPHTFWNYIFINKNEYENGKLEKELLTHELTHVAQRHTIDVLVVELFKIIFWFNPIFYFLKKLIQLNHEFIADNKVIYLHKNISEYQHLLLNKAAWNNDYYLASNLNYSLTKKRLVMMSTQTSKVNNWLKKLAVIPLLTGSIYVFAERVESYEMINNEPLENEILEKEAPEKRISTPVISNEKESNNGFLASIEKSEKDAILKCYNCERWAKLKIPLNKEYTITDWGFTNNSNIDRGNYAFSIKITDNKVLFRGLKNTAWKTLSFSLSQSKKQYLNHKGMIVQKEDTKLYKKENSVKTSTAAKPFNKIKKSPKKQKITSKENNSVSSVSKNLQTTTRVKINPSVLVQTDNLNKPDLVQTTTSKNDKYKIIANDQSKEIAAYKKLKSKYDNLRKKKPHYIESEPERKNELDKMYSDLGLIYFQLSKENRRKIKRAVFPYSPYIKIKKFGDFSYKLPNELTEEDKLFIPPPAAAPDASEEDKAKAKKAFRKWVKKIKKHSDKKSPKPVKIEVKDKSKKGMVKLNNQDLYYITNSKGTKYYNRWGQEVNKKGDIINPEKKFPVVKKSDKTNIPPPPPPPRRVLKEVSKKGMVKVDDKTLYYITNKQGTKYYNRWGQEVNKKGEIINPEKKFPVIKKTDDTNIPPPPPPPTKKKTN